MRPDSLPRLWRYINLLLTYLLNVSNQKPNVSVPALWRSTVSNQWQNASVSPLWRSTAFNQWPNVLALLIDDLLCQTSDRASQYPLSDNLLCLTNDQTSLYPFMTIDCVQSVAKRLSIPLWRSTVAIFYWLSFGTKPRGLCQGWRTGSKWECTRLTGNNFIYANLSWLRHGCSADTLLSLFQHHFGHHQVWLLSSHVELVCVSFLAILSRQ